MVTDWPATIDRRYHDAVILNLDGVLSAAASGGFRASESTGPLLRRLREAGIGTAVYSGTREGAQLSGGLIDELAEVDAVEFADEHDSSVLIRTAGRLKVRPDRCVVIEHDPAGVEDACAAGFSLVIALDHGSEELTSHGADAVIADLAEISVRNVDSAISAITDALQVYSQLKELVTARQPVVFVDFDGTMADIVGQPETAALVPGAADALRALTPHCPVAVISGRDLADLRARIDVDGLWFAGSHGFELVAPDGTLHQNADAAASVGVLVRAAVRLADELKDIPGTIVERKRYAVAVHYRNTDPQAVDRVIAAVRRLGRSAGLRVTTGRKLVELRPNVSWDKGKALHWILEHLATEQNSSSTTTLPIFIGDDISDEDGFDAIRFDGVGIAVRHLEGGDRPSAATFSLESPSAVTQFLQRLADDLRDEAAAPSDAWELVYDHYDPATERLRETLCTVGNGYVATRGCAAEATASQHHYPGTYGTGVYNILADQIAGRTIENESLVNLPNWLSLTFRIDGGPWFHIDQAEILSYRQTFDLRHATLSRRVRFTDAAGRITTLDQQRFASMHDPHLLAMKTVVEAENWSGTIEFESVLDATVRNTMVERYSPLSSAHLTESAIDEIVPNGVVLRTETSQSRIAIALATRSTVWDGSDALTLADAQHTLIREHNRAGHHIAVAVSAGRPVTLEKITTIFTGRDAAIAEPAAAAAESLDAADRYADLHQSHTRAWARLWEQCNIGLTDGDDALRILRLHLVHVLQTISPHTAELDAGVPARGLHGEAYRGHVFWDSLFISPVLSLRMSNVSRSLLLYRYRRLPEARRAARRAGHLGAMFPWQSGSDGREVSQEVHLNPQSGRWLPDASARAHHVGLAVAYNTWQNYQVSGDRQFLVDYGAEMLVEIARFWVGLANFDAGLGRYTIRGIIGPDEFHSGYPGREYDGIDNNAYTNVMAVWVILRAMEALDLLPLRDRLELVAKLGLTTQERERWDHVSRRMFVPFHDGVISQFEGYAELAELDWDGYRQRYDNIQRLDRILEAENDSVNNYKASKQADALMLFYLLSSEELLGLFGRLGYHFAPAQIPKTVDYYLSRTSDGSTLSAVVHSWVLARAHRANALEYFQQVLDSDITDIQGGTTAEGIHLAAMAGSVDLLQRCFTGLETRDDRLILSPQWPDGLGPIEFPFVYRGHRLHLQLSGRSATLTAESGGAGPIDVECRGRIHRLRPGSTIEVG